MGIEQLENIKTILKNTGVEFEVIEHEPVRTSEDAARIRNEPLKEGIKAIVVKTRGADNFYVVDVPADRRVDLKKVEKIIGAKSVTLANAEEVLRETGCEVGGVPPLGHKKPSKIYVDEKVFDNEFNEFNAGLTTVSIRIKSNELRKAFNALNAIVCDVAK